MFCQLVPSVENWSVVLVDLHIEGLEDGSAHQHWRGSWHQEALNATAVAVDVHWHMHAPVGSELTVAAKMEDLVSFAEPEVAEWYASLEAVLQVGHECCVS